VEYEFSIKSFDKLSENGYASLLMILIYLSPETLWEVCEMDEKDLKKMPHIIEQIDTFFSRGTLEQKLLFIINSVFRITGKNNLVGFDDLY